GTRSGYQGTEQEMSIGIWYAYCARERLMSLDDLARRLMPDSALTVRREQENLLVVTVHDSLTGNDADVTISIDTGPHVAIEAAELAEGWLTVDEGVPPPDAEALRRADARYELNWELLFSDETYNAMLVIADDLIQACGAIVYDVTNRRYV